MNIFRSRISRGRRVALLVIATATTAATLGGCAKKVPEDRYGVKRLQIEGAEQVDEDEIKARIATKAHPTWAWPWTEWPLYDETVFERDRERIERIYRARGYYDARVTEVRRVFDDEARRVELQVLVTEGAPVRVRSVRVTGLEALTPTDARHVQNAVIVERGARFDELDYDLSKQAVERALGNASYAAARVTGKVVLDPRAHTADILFHVSPGHPCRFGKITVEGNGDLPALPVLGAAAIREGQPYSEDAIDDARLGVYTLGAFASVETITEVDDKLNLVHLRLRVVPGRRFRYGVGVGVEAGGPQSQSSGDVAGANFAQWDLHLLGRVEHRNFLGGMRRLRVEERPRLIFNDPFPGAGDPHLGNAISADLRQPAFVEARTTLVAHTRWDVGPDPFGGQFFRSDLILGIGPERRFFGGRLLAQSSINANFFNELTGVQDGPYPDYLVSFVQHRLQLELRDNPRLPRSGGYFAATLQHAGYIVRSDWNYVRITPEARGYLPLPWRMVLAGRVRLGMLFVTSSNIHVPTDDPDGFVQRLADLGPLRERLRGGGGNSVRGYVANTLGDVTYARGRLDSGGLRQWEASLELRMLFTDTLGAVLFVDAGDVSRMPRFRFDQPQTTLGVGLRYHTLVGPLRLDLGLTPPSLQSIGPDERVRTGLTESTVFGASGNIQLTIGEAF